ncbi:MAG: phosphotransferase enzyme family protein [Sandaracinaceae bacterium]
MSAVADVPEAVRDAYGLDERAVATPITSGWINRTLLVTQGDDRFVLQLLHRIFAAEVNEDIEACTLHLVARGVPSPTLRRTVDGRVCVEHGAEVWRALEYIEGETLGRLPSLAHAEAAGAFVARFHGALRDLAHAFRFTRAGVHDTRAHLDKLTRLRADASLGFAERARADRWADRVLDAARSIEPLPTAPLRIVHGDLKVTNLRFASDGSVVGLVDLDTLARGALAIDLGDALRSWCNPTDEADPNARFDRAVFEAAMRGYLREAREWLSVDERSAIVPAIVTIGVELAARFAADLYEDSYFGFDSARFASRRAHNLSRVEAQLALAADVARIESELTGWLERESG